MDGPSVAGSDLDSEGEEDGDDFDGDSDDQSFASIDDLDSTLINPLILPKTWV